MKPLQFGSETLDGMTPRADKPVLNLSLDIRVVLAIDLEIARVKALPIVGERF